MGGEGSEAASLSVLARQVWASDRGFQPWRRGVLAKTLPYHSETGSGTQLAACNAPLQSMLPDGLRRSVRAIDTIATFLAMPAWIVI